MRKSDEAHELTDKELLKLEKRIAAEYKKAAEEMQDKVDAYFRAFAKRDAEQKAKLDAGEITEQQYKQWRLKNLVWTEKFLQLLDEIANDIFETNEKATNKISQTLPAVYLTNYDQEADEINEEEKSKIPLLLTVSAAILFLKKKENKIDSPKVKKKKDIAWNKQKFTAAVTSGVLSGAPITGKNSFCVTSVNFVIKQNRDLSITNARTFVTSTETKARQKVYNIADKLGIHRIKTWYTQEDAKVRPAHATMDRISVPWTEKFIVAGYEMEGPGDRSAPIELWINCRCRMKSERE